MMKIIISPAKGMEYYPDEPGFQDTPVFLEKAQQLLDYLRSLSYPELKKLLCCNDQIATLNFQRYRNMDLLRGLSPALLSYVGIQYQYMAPRIFEYTYFDYVRKHLRILSGFYGILRPFDGVVPYRLEMQAKPKGLPFRNLYDFWGDCIFRELTKNTRTILNLASAEYSRCIEKHLTPDISYITCIFGEQENGKIREKGFYVKMARGEMVRFMAENDIRRPEDVKHFDRLGYSYRDDLSAPERYVFLRQTKKDAEQ